ncbi:MAG: molybdopterin-binding protein, partial [Candidatus Aminicenantales bacterium]
KIFWRVAVKPGKPMFFGMNSKRSVFGLPGNPVSSLLSYLEFVRPALLKMMGRSDVFLPEKEAVLEEKIVKRPGRLHFVRGIYEEKQGSIRMKSSGLQDSHVLESFSRANCLILLDRDRTEFAKGSSVRIQLLPW